LKGLILCGGKGTRLRPMTYSRPKHLLPVMNKPVLYYGIEKMIAAGITDIAVVVPPHYRSAFDEALLGGAPWNIHISLVEQPEPRGLADAVRAAERYIGRSNFLLYLGDNVIDGSLEPLVRKFQDEYLDGLISVSQVEHPEQFGVVKLDGDRILQVVEKPKYPPSRLAINGVYLFKPYIFEAIAKIRPSARGEYELTDAIQQMIDDRCKVGVFRSQYWWKDTGQPKDILLCNQHFLRQMDHTRIEGDVDAGSTITGDVVIGENTKIVNSVIRGPVIIGNDAVIENAYVGPYCSIADHVSVVGCEIENSIVMDHTRLDGVPHRISDSMIGGEVNMAGIADQPRTAKLWIGDHSRIHFPEG